MTPRAQRDIALLLAQEVAEVGDRILGVADILALGLSTVEFFAFDVGEGGGDLAVFEGSAFKVWEKRVGATNLRLRWR